MVTVTAKPPRDCADRRRELWGQPPPTASPMPFSTADISIQLLMDTTRRCCNFLEKPYL
jgi:hypothetical protein